MITDADIESATAWLLSNAAKAAEYRAERVYAEEYRKSLKAILMNECNLKTAAAKEAWAYAHDRYIAHLGELKTAVFNDEKNRAERAAASMKIEAWRTQSSNARAVRL